MERGMVCVHLRHIFTAILLALCALTYNNNNSNNTFYLSLDDYVVCLWLQVNSRYVKIVHITLCICTLYSPCHAVYVHLRIYTIHLCMCVRVLYRIYRIYACALNYKWNITSISNKHSLSNALFDPIKLDTFTHTHTLIYMNECTSVCISICLLLLCRFECECECDCVSPYRI